jgi:hypothetical protein
MHDLTPVLVSSSVSTLLQYSIYTGSVYFIMQLLNSVVGFFTVLPVLLIALLWTSYVFNISVFNRLILGFTVLPYKIPVNTVKKVPYSGKQKQ